MQKKHKYFICQLLPLQIHYGRELNYNKKDMTKFGDTSNHQINKKTNVEFLSLLTGKIA